jgi:hypothetical protein
MVGLEARLRINSADFLLIIISCCLFAIVGIVQNEDLMKNLSSSRHHNHRSLFVEKGLRRCSLKIFGLWRFT